MTLWEIIVGFFAVVGAIVVLVPTAITLLCILGAIVAAILDR